VYRLSKWRRRLMTRDTLRRCNEQRHVLPKTLFTRRNGFVLLIKTCRQNPLALLPVKTMSIQLTNMGSKFPL
jgi:hypothetical protein